MKIANDAKTNTHKRILDIAEQLLLQCGFNAFSYQLVSRELGIRNAAIHYHFPHKTDLGVALIQRYRRRLQRFITAQADLAPQEQLERFFDLTQSYFMRDQQVCPSGMLTMEFLSLPPEMREEAAAFIEEMRAWSIEIVRRGRQAGVFDFPGEDAAMGALLFSALQGGLQLARVDPGWLETIKRQMRALMGVQQLSNQRSADATV